MNSKEVKIYCPDLKQQLILFNGLQWKNGSFSDLDGVFDYFNKGWFFLEIKRVGVPTTLGQKILLERLVKAMFSVGKFSIAIIAEHTQYNPHIPIVAGDCFVRNLRMNDGIWRKPDKPITVKNLLDACAAAIDKNIAREWR